MKNGVLTAETLQPSRRCCPHWSSARSGARHAGELFSLLTVETLCLMIERHRPAGRE
jgi:hypothetical protein